MKVGSRARLPHRRLLTVLSIAGLAVAVALPVVLLSVGGGVYAHERAALTNAGYQIAVSAPGSHGIDGAHPLEQSISAIAGVTEVSPVLESPIEVWVQGRASPVLAEGILPGPFLATQVPEAGGLFPHPLPLGDPTDAIHYANGTYAGASADRILLSTPFAQDAGVRVGDAVRIGAQANASATREVIVAGLFGVAGPSIAPTAVFGALLPLSDLQVLVGLAAGPAGVPLDAADSVEVGLALSAAADSVSIHRIAAEIAALVPYYSVTPLDDQANQLAEAEGVLEGFYVGLSAVGLTIGLAFLTLVLLREVEAERRGIGVRRALGVPSQGIVGGIVVRGAALAAGGALGGVALGTAVIESLARWGTGSVATVATLAVFDPVTLTALSAGIVGLSLIASASAARAALRVPIAEALR